MYNIRWLTDQDPASAEEVGGKAASLFQLTRAGFRVPLGFVVSADFANRTNDETATSAILTAFDQLGANLVAVRSSATVEDGTQSAWAGQFTTFLDVGRQQILERIAECTRSFASERALAYANNQTSASHEIVVHVIVEEMIHGEISGVAFTAHPVTGEKNLVIVEAITGLGEALVSGRVTPDTYIIDKQSYQTIESTSVSAGAILNHEQSANICQVACKIEQLYGFPVDIEWTLCNNTLYILQARPITTLQL